MTSIHIEDQVKEMSTRLTCNVCDYRTTSETVLNRHKQLNHEKKTNLKDSKRKFCKFCNKKFNKEETLTKHISKCHTLKSQNNQNI